MHYFRPPREIATKKKQKSSGGLHCARRDSGKRFGFGLVLEQDPGCQGPLTRAPSTRPYHAMVTTLRSLWASGLTASASMGHSACFT